MAFNRLQWTGDYLAAGVGRIAASVNNTGANELNLRVTLNGGGGRFSSLVPVVVPVASGWIEIEFAIEADDLACATDAFCGGTVQDTLGSVTELRILSAVSGPQFRGDQIAATAGFDDITALPEPSSLLLQAAALSTLGLLARRRPHA